MNHTIIVPGAFYSESYEPRQARREVREKIRAWAAAEPNFKLVGIRRLHRPYPDRLLWWQADIVLSRVCPFGDEPLTLGLSRRNVEQAITDLRLAGKPVCSGSAGVGRVVQTELWEAA